MQIQRKRSGYQECDGISWRQVIQMNMIMTRVFPLGIDVRKLPLVNIPIVIDIFEVGRVRNYQARPSYSTDEWTDTQVVDCKGWIGTQVFPNTKKAPTKKAPVFI